MRLGKNQKAFLVRALRGNGLIWPSTLDLHKGFHGDTLSVASPAQIRGIVVSLANMDLIVPHEHTAWRLTSAGTKLATQIDEEAEAAWRAEMDRRAAEEDAEWDRIHGKVE